MKNVFEKLTHKQVGITGIVIALFTILPYAAILFSRLISHIMFYFQGYNFGYIRFVYYYYDIENGLAFNVLDVLFSLVLIIASLLYIRTKGKEVRLLRFCFFVGFISAAFLMLRRVYLLTQPSTEYLYLNKTGILLYLLSRILFCLVFLFLLKRINRDRNPAVEQYGEGNAFVKASAWLRLVNLIIDSLVCVAVILLPLLSFFDNFPQTMPENLFLSILFLISRLFYYLICESLLGATPGKMLTETRVLKVQREIGVGMSETIYYKEGIPSFLTMLGRTLLRFIPFEAIIFLLGGRLHDIWSKTDVIVEERTGKRGRFFFFIFLGLALVWPTIHFGGEMLSDMKRERENKEREKYVVENKLAVLRGKIERLSPDAYLEFSYNEYYKVERVSGDSLICRFMSDRSQDSVEDLENIYMELSSEDITSSLPELILSKEILQSYLKEKYDLGFTVSEPFMVGDTRLKLEDIYFVDEPLFEWWNNYRTEYSGDTVRYAFKNMGWAVNIIDTQIVKGDIEWVEMTNNFSLGHSAKKDIQVNLVRKGEPDIEIIFTNENALGRQSKYCFKIKDDLVSLVELP